MRPLPDGAHVIKSTDSGVQHHKIRLDGWLVGNYQLWSRYHDSDRQWRESVRANVTASEVRAKNRFSVEEMDARRSRKLQRSMTSPQERLRQSALVVSTLGPARNCQWKQNLPSMYANPMGGDYSTRSGHYYYADPEMRQVRKLKILHTPCDNAVVCASRIQRPIDTALIFDGAAKTSHLYITESHHESAGIWVVDVTAMEKQWAAAEAAANASDSAAGPQRLELTGTRLQEPYGIVAWQARRELFVSDRAGKSVCRLVLATPMSAVVTTLFDLSQPPAGLAVQGSSLAVAAGDTVYLWDFERNQRSVALTVDGAEFCGVSLAPAALGHALYAINREGNVVLRLQRSANPPNSFLPSSSAETLVGGNEEYPTGTWYEGTASKVKLWQPTMCCFADNCLIFSNPGRGRFGKVLLLSDVYPFANQLMPALGSISDAFCLSEDDSKHSLNLFHAALQLEVCQDMLDKIENDNFHIHGVARGREGDAGNFSGVVRRSVRQLVDGFTGYVAFLSELGVPTRCFDAMCTRAAMTLMNENFFTEMRRR